MSYRIYLPAFLSFIFFSLSSYSQLSGYYTIGGNDADYASIFMAIDDLENQGIDGETTFALNPGTYNGFDINTIEGTSPDSYFILKSASNDSSDVIISGTVEVNSVEFVKLKHLSFITGNQKNLVVNQSRFVFFESCNYISDYDDNYEAAIDVGHYSNDEMYISIVTFNHCSFLSQSMNMYSGGRRGDLRIFNSEFTALDSGLCIHAWNNYKVKLDNIVFNGGIDIDANIGAYSYLKNAIITGEVNAGKFDTVMNTNVYSDMIIRLTSDYFENCHFEGTEFTDSSHGTNGGSWFIDNYFDCPVKVHFASHPTMINNFFNGDLHLSFNDALLFSENMVIGDFHFGDMQVANWNYRIYNNIFSGGRVDAGGENAIISYNSFIDGAFLNIYWQSIMVYDNLFCEEIVGNPGIHIAHNNFYPLEYCQFDTASTHYNPMYSEDVPGMATNPLLQGKGVYEAPEFDYFGNLRKTPAALGANEIFICTDSLNNEITVPCNEKVYLNFCNLPETGDFWWEPEDCVEHPDSAYTMVEACENGMTVYLYNSIEGLVDSITIYTESFEVEVADMPMFYCDYPRRITATFHPNATYQWTPEYGLSDPNSRTPILNVDDTDFLEYVVECDIEGCGISYDTLHIDFDSLPYPQLYYPQQSHDTVYFECTSRCTDAYLWEFGDGTTSTERETFHIYSENGTYTISLTVFNEYGSQSASFDYNYYWLSDEQEINQSKKIKVYPNPVKDVLSIEGLPTQASSEIFLLNLSGMVIWNQTTKSSVFQLQTNDIKPGVYFLRIIADNTMYIKKIIINH